ncbi:MAG: monovalent cation:proton antiporter-2 (CPA2) family protein [Pseudomonadales bacterium]
MDFLTEALIFLGAAVLVVPLCKRLGLSSVLGYLGAGLLIGQPGLGLVQDAHGILHFAEIGVVLLLFVIGLELQPRRLWVMRRLVFGLGTLQVGFTALAIAALLLLLGLDPGAASLLGFALALSSTAFVLQLLGEQKKLNQLHGRAAFGTLLLQDVAVIPAIAVVNLLAAGGAFGASQVGGAADGHAAGPQPLLILAVLAGAVALRYLLRPILKFVAASGVRELFTAAALALVAGAALAMGHAGLSMGLGAFAAGMMVADSPYRHQLETDVDPFKGLLLGLFFMAVGMTVDLGLLIGAPLTILGLTAALVLVKILVLIPLARLQGLGGPDALRTAIVLSQGGEFAFVLLTAAVSAGLVGDGLAQTAVLVVTLSMAATPLLVALGDRWMNVDRDADARPYDRIDDAPSRVVVAGFGRVGQIVARVLTMRHIPFTALEINPHHVDFVRSYGNEVFYGDATRLDVLRSAGVPNARALVLAVGNEEASLKIVEMVRATCPGVAILARATTRNHELQLREIGVDFVLRDTLHSSLRLARELLGRLGLSATEAAEAVARFEAHDARTLERQAAVFRDEEAFRRATVNAGEELKGLFAEDAVAEPDEGGPAGR